MIAVKKHIRRSSFLLRASWASNGSLARDSGAVMLEFALVVGAFVLLILGIIDFSRVFAAKALLTKGAQEGLNLAQKLEYVNVDTRTWADETADPGYLEDAKLAGTANDGSYYRVIRAATALPLNSAVLSTEPNSFMEMLKFSSTVSMGGGGSVSISDQYAALIRPGEKAQVASSYGTSSSSETIYHSTLCTSDTSDPCTTSTGERLSSGGNYDAVLEQHPIEVHMRARVKMITPGLSDLVVSGVARGYREIVAKSSLPIPDAPTPPIPPTTVGPWTDPGPCPDNNRDGCCDWWATRCGNICCPLGRCIGGACLRDVPE